MRVQSWRKVDLIGMYWSWLKSPCWLCWHFTSKHFAGKMPFAGEEVARHPEGSNRTLDLFPWDFLCASKVCWVYFQQISSPNGFQGRVSLTAQSRSKTWAWEGRRHNTNAGKKDLLRRLCGSFIVCMRWAIHVLVCMILYPQIKEAVAVRILRISLKTGVGPAWSTPLRREKSSSSTPPILMKLTNCDKPSPPELLWFGFSSIWNL